MIDLSWYVVHTKSREEDRAQLHLLQQDFLIYLPKFERAAGRDGIPRILPLFPGYLFIALNPSVCPWRAINSTPGVNYILSDADGKPKSVDVAVVDAIKAREVAPNLISMDPEAWSDLDVEPGDPVTVTGGPFLGHPAIFKCHLDKNRVALLMDIMGVKATEVVAGVDDVRAG